MKTGRYSKQSPLEARFIGDYDAIRDYLDGKTILEVSQDIDRSIERTRTLFRKYDKAPKSEAGGIRVVADCGGLEAAREYIESHTAEHLMKRYKIAPCTLYNWEGRLGCRAKRTCRNCRKDLPYEQMWLNSRGRVQDSLCADPECKKAKKRGTDGHADRLDLEFAGLGPVLRMTRKRLTRRRGGRLLSPYQGRAAGEMG